MAKAPIEEHFTVKGYEYVKVGIIKWSMSVIRLRCEDEKKIIDLADEILKKYNIVNKDNVNKILKSEIGLVFVKYCIKICDNLPLDDLNKFYIFIKNPK